MKIKCVTLFDITKTGASRRQIATKDANQQINFETILQIISMRCQPENITSPKRIVIDKKDARWGEKYLVETQNILAWEFFFDVYHREVFNDGENKLGNLYSDSNEVPMIVNLDETSRLSSKINTSGELKNIHYEIIQDD